VPETTRGTTAEHRRLETVEHPDLLETNEWYRWGPYLAERAWGSVREDYSESGDAWSSFPHDHARSRAYRWNEDGMAGISDVRQRLCLALALWNGRDPILKERMFGLTGAEANHGEDAKEYWWYTDGLPSHAWLTWRYHYPQAAFPYDDLVAENGRRGFHDPEYELLDTGVFDDDRYWGVEVTYAKADADDILMRISVTNHGPDAEELHVLPTLWFRNRWSWGDALEAHPAMELRSGVVRARIDDDETYELIAAAGPGGAPVALFCDNETNTERLYGEPGAPFPKDGINDHVVAGAETVNPDAVGTKAAWWYRVQVAPQETVELRLRLRRVTGAATGTELPPPTAPTADVGTDFDQVLAQRQQEADEFYAALTPATLDAEEARIVRQACAGLVWSKQYYPYRVRRWLDGDPGQPPPPDAHRHGRNAGWRHLDADDILAMPDPWEYPWFAAWDLAFHAIAWAHIDPAFAKYQILVLLREWFLNPNGALPAYEWNFDDVNPPVHAFAALLVFQIAGDDDHDFLERVFQKLLLNYMWWLNRQDPDGNNLFGGGFLGLDNISPIDRSHLPKGATLVQADGSAWMAFNSLAMLTMALRLSAHDHVYDDMVITFLERFIAITQAINHSGMFEPERGFFYDFVDSPGGRQRVEVETIGGAVPLFSAVAVRSDSLRSTGFRRRLRRLLERQERTVEELTALGRLRSQGDAEELLVSVVTPDQLRATLVQLFDESAFLSPHGLRSVSKRYDGNPYTIVVDGETYDVDYEPAEGTTPMYGGNSNWRGPVWMPMNFLAIRSLARFHDFVGDEFTVEYPTGSGQQRTLLDISQDLADRVTSMYRRDADGRRPVWGGLDRFQHDPAWDNLLFFEYFHGDNGAGLGASHQTGWTALVVDLLLRPPAQMSPLSFGPST
jgi:hypothetical protein